MSSRVESLLPADRHGTWLVTTENGTKTYFDFDDALWMRVPAQRPDGTTNRLEHDLRWKRLGHSPTSVRRGEPDQPPPNRWIFDRVERGEDSRTLRAWLARLDEERSVLTWLRAHVVVEEDSSRQVFSTHVARCAPDSYPRGIEVKCRGRMARCSR